MGDTPEKKSIIVNLDRRFILFLGKMAIVALIVFFFFLILPYSGMVLTPFIIAVLLSFVLNPVVIFLERLGLNRTLAGAAVMIFLTALFVLLLILIFPLVDKEIRALTQFVKNETPASVSQKVETFLASRFPFLKNPEIATKLMAKLETIFYSLLSKTIAMIPGLLSMAIMVFLTPFMTFFLLKDGRRMKKALIQALPNRYFEMGVNLIHKIDGQLGSYIRGQLLVSLCVGSLAVFALFILGVPNFFIIGIAAGLANMIPYFGPIVGAIPALILNFIAKGTASSILYVILVFVAIRLIDDTLISPNILGRSLEIHPMLVLVAIFIGGEMFGIMGLLLCIPVTGIIKVTIREVLWSIKHYRFSRS